MQCNRLRDRRRQARIVGPPLRQLGAVRRRDRGRRVVAAVGAGVDADLEALVRVRLRRRVRQRGARVDVGAEPRAGPVGDGAAGRAVRQVLVEPCRRCRRCRGPSPVPITTAVRRVRAGVHEPGLRGRRPRQHQLRRLHARPRSRATYSTPSWRSGGRTTRAWLGQSPTGCTASPGATGRARRDLETVQRDAAGCELLLLARVLGAEPSRLHDRVGHADAVRQPEQAPCWNSPRPPPR